MTRTARLASMEARVEGYNITSKQLVKDATELGDLELLAQIEKINDQVDTLEQMLRRKLPGVTRI